MTAHIRIDLKSGRERTVKCTTAKIVAITMTECSLSRDETLVLGDRRYNRKKRSIGSFKNKADETLLRPTKELARATLSEEKKRFNRLLLPIRAFVAQPFRVIKQRFGYAKIRNYDLAENTGQIATVFALTKPLTARE